MNHKKKLRIIIFSACTILCMIAIFLFSSQNADESSALSDGLLARLPAWIRQMILPITSQGVKHDIRKYAHMFEYFCLGCSSVLLFREVNDFKALPGLIESEVLCSAYACSDEYHQTFIPGRSGSFHDVLIDGFGFSFGICIITAFGIWIYAMKRREIREDVMLR